MIFLFGFVVFACSFKTDVRLLNSTDWIIKASHWKIDSVKRQIMSQKPVGKTRGYEFFKTDLHPLLPSPLEPEGLLRWVAALCDAAVLTEAPGGCLEVSLSTPDHPARSAGG